MAAVVLAQRQRDRLRRQQALLVARAHEEERAWVASELHDDILQRVALVRAEIEALVPPGAPVDPLLMPDRLRGINAELQDLAVSVRRVAARLHPTVVDQVGLVAALAALRDEVARGSGVQVLVSHVGDPARCSRETARAAYRITQEALRNVVRHAQAREARVHLEFSGEDLRLCVEDDGRGFAGPEPPRTGLGIASMRERALIVGGTAEVRSRPGSGTSLDVRLPLGEP